MSPARLIAYAALALVAAYLLAVGLTRMREGRCEYAQGWYARGKGHLDCSKPKAPTAGPALPSPRNPA